MNNKIFETKKSSCPKCGKELIRLEPYSTKGVSEFWCDDCNIKITIDDKNREELNTEFSAKDLFIKAIKKYAKQDSNLKVQYNVGDDADADNVIISESFAKKILAEDSIDSVKEVIDNET